MNNVSVFKLLFASLSGFSLLLLLLFVLLPYLTFIANGPAWYTYCLAFISFYLVYCILSCTRLLSGTLLVMSGFVMHLGLAAFAIVIVMYTGNLLLPFLGAVFAVLWTTLCISRLRKESRS